MNKLRGFWYIIAVSSELKQNQVLSKTVCNEALVVFRGLDGKACVMPDRCLHRCAKLSKGKVKDGILTCPYHGWSYNQQGQVCNIPAHFGCKRSLPTKKHAYLSQEQDGYIYVCLDEVPKADPFPMPKTNDTRFSRVRLVNTFNNTLTNCVENFIDIPHTAFVHKGIFRKVQNEAITANVKRNKGHVQIDYKNEQQNLGSFSWALNPKRKSIVHQDNFYAPNITQVIYALADKWTYMITSQSVPASHKQTVVYTEICYDFGFLNKVPLFSWLIRRQAQKVINQDINILNQQMQVIEQFGEQFWHTSADVIHQYVSEIIDSLQEHGDFHNISHKEQEVQFWV